MKYYVTGFMYSTDRANVALIEKKQPAWQKGLLNGIGGKIEAGENPQDAMALEFFEEAGVVTQAHQWKTFAILERPSQYKVYFLYTCNDDVYNVRSMEQEVVSIYQSNNLPNNVKLYYIAVIFLFNAL